MVTSSCYAPGRSSRRCSRRCSCFPRPRFARRGPRRLGLPLSVLAMQLADVVLQQALPCVFVSVTYRPRPAAASNKARRVPARRPGGGLRGRVARLFDRLFVPRLRVSAAGVLVLRRCVDGVRTRRSPPAFPTQSRPLWRRCLSSHDPLGGLYTNVGAIPVGARWINKVCLRARDPTPFAIYRPLDATRSPHRSTRQLRLPGRGQSQWRLR